jgi:hypothetical protein
MENLVGQMLNRYRIMSLLGEGGMGAVYKAHDTTLERDVAIKVMHSHIGRQPNFQERFLQEARTAARLDHPGIVQIHDFGSYKNQLYIVMKFIPGDNLDALLRNLLAQDRWIPLSEAVQLVRQVALAIDYAHRQGVLHRDIKPGNIMLEPEPSDGLPYRPVVTDLGLAKLAGGVMTVDGSSMGTPAYMSPEQAMGRPTDSRSDVYSLGILLYELAVGRLPFNPHSITEAIQMHVHTPPPSPRTLRPDLPPALETIILQAVEKDPARRFQNAQALADALKAALPAAERVAAPPTGISATVSLMTQYQNSLVEARGESLFADFQDAPGGGDHIEVMAADQTSMTVLVRPGGLTVGRDPDCDIALDDPKVSRRHARIEKVGQVVQVTDLGSTNGSFLEGRRLDAHTPTAWVPGTALRIGGAHLRLVTPAVANLDATMRGPSPVPATMPSPPAPTRAGAGVFPAAPLVAPPVARFTSDLRPERLNAGDIGQVVVRNLGSANERFSISWLSPGETLIFTPPRLQVDIPPGQEVVAEFRAEPASSGLIGGRRDYPYSAQVSSTGGSLPQTHHGQVSARAAVPGWAVPLLLVLCVALVGGLVLLSGLVFGGGGGIVAGGPGASQTNSAEQTQVALAVAGTRQAGSATAAALEGANQATLQAATATGAAEQTIAAATNAVNTQLAATYSAQTLAAYSGQVQTAAAETAVGQNATIQAGAQQTAAAQQTAIAFSLTQTGVAGQQTLQAGAYQTAAALTAWAAQQTGQAQSLTLTAQAQKRVIYLYHSDSDTANDYRSFLQSQGYQVDLVSVIDAAVQNYGMYNAILIGPDTGNQSDWHDNPWVGPGMSNAAASSGTPIIGLGQGGSLFFQSQGLTIGYGNTWVGSGKDVYVMNPNNQIWRNPFDVAIPNNRIIKLYDQTSSFVAVYSTDGAGINELARQEDDNQHYLIAIEDERFLLWGFDAGPAAMSPKGQRTFLNILWNFAR